ncbi:hypothetical protein D9756_009185 [Leucocoprinus leucothites]|uniref:Methyltransferase domain-containing protein n=1 Tax=Leucocoprinus leucothites TaxID=201217 RepID=A0A8H5CXT9_9AGAR|nr:hypothetical protein D9756_009185 [Leucoagaricus leucothites]
MTFTHILPQGEPQIEKSRRYYVSTFSNDHKYLLPADEEERERLNNQSQGIIQIFDNKLIWAPVSLKDEDIVLDSGTGSGHWLLSLAKERDIYNKIPSVYLRGIDISSRMFPPPSLTPSNTTFSIDSITSLPMSWSNTISLIHQRLLMAALQAPQWHSALSEMYRVLAPGGWIQLFEGHHLFDSPSEAVTHHKAFQIRDKLCFETRNVIIDITKHLPEWIEQAGFVNLKIEKRGMPMGASWADESSVVGAKAVNGFWNGIKGPVMKEGGFGIVSSEEEYDTIVRDILRLCEETPGTYWPILVFTAQKPEI